MSEHRWSGWPGAWCFDCGCDDPNEAALANDHIIWVGEEDEYGNQNWIIDPEKRGLYAPAVCPEPGSKRHDPYANRIKEGHKR